MLRRFTWLLVLAVSAVAFAADEKVPTGSITGTVVDKAGRVVPECIVTCLPANQKMKVSVGDGKTDKDGKFTLEKIPDGEYNVRFNTSDGRSSAVKTIQIIEGGAVDMGKIVLRSK